jgi:hypothetical protein
LMAVVSQHNANKKIKITIGNGHKCQCWSKSKFK